MTILPAVPSLGRRAAAVARDERGVAAIELAFILPIALVIAFGAFLAQDAFQVSAKAEAAAAEVTDIVSQQSSVTASQLDTILGVSAAILTPYDKSNYQIAVSQVAIDASGAEKVAWSRTYRGTALTTGAPLNLPSTVAVNSSYLIYATASYSWTPQISVGFFGPITISKTVYRLPRTGKSISCGDCP